VSLFIGLGANFDPSIHWLFKSQLLLKSTYFKFNPVPAQPDWLITESPLPVEGWNVQMAEKWFNVHHQQQPELEQGLNSIVPQSDVG
jgi:hypothetical protein